MQRSRRDRFAVGIIIEPIESRLMLSGVVVTSESANSVSLLASIGNSSGVMAQRRAAPADSGEEDSPPSAAGIISPVGLAVAAGAVLKYQLLVTGNPTPSVHLVSGPAGMTIRHGVLSWSPGSSALGIHRVTVVAKNALGKRRKTFSIDVTTDLTPPTAPVAMVGTVTATDSLPLSWTPATDNIAVAGYRVYGYTPAQYRGHSGRDGGITLVSPAKLALIADHLTTTSYTVTGLAADSTSQYVVGAYDAAGNQSDSNIVTGTTLVGPSLTYSSDGVNSNPPLTIAVGQSLYLTLDGTGNPALTLSLKSAPAGVTFTPGQITNSQLTFVVPHIIWTPTADQVGSRSIVMLASNSVDTFTLNIPVTVTAS